MSSSAQVSLLACDLPTLRPARRILTTAWLLCLPRFTLICYRLLLIIRHCCHRNPPQNKLCLIVTTLCGLSHVFESRHLCGCNKFSFILTYMWKYMNDEPVFHAI